MLKTSRKIITAPSLLISELKFSFNNGSTYLLFMLLQETLLYHPSAAAVPATSWLSFLSCLQLRAILYQSGPVLYREWGETRGWTGGPLGPGCKKPRLWKISSELKFAAANKCDKAKRTWQTDHVMQILYQLDFYKPPGLLGVLIWTMALSHSNLLASVSFQNKVGFWQSHTGPLWTAPHETSSNGSMSPDGLNPRLLKHYSTVNHILMEQMASSEIKQPFSSSKKQINWGRGGIISIKWPGHDRKSHWKRLNVTQQ